MISTQNIVLVRKRTKWERDLILYGSEKAALSIYRLQDHAHRTVFPAHQRQMENLEKIKATLPKMKCIYREELSDIGPKERDLLVCFGGDNHFIHVAQQAQETPLLGLNSDPLSSTGALLYFSPDEFISFISAFKENKTETLSSKAFSIEQWRRVEGKLILANKGIDKKIKIGPCISEISLRNSFYDHISRFLLRKNNENWEEWKCSGLLLACGAGSSGWYRNAHPKPHQAVFSKEAPFFKALPRETQYLIRQKLRQSNSIIHEGEYLEVISKMNGEITIDANADQVLPFPPGARASFFLSKQSLKVIRKSLS